MNRHALVLLALCFLVASAALAADDALKAAPSHFKVLFENDEVRVLQYNAKAGDKIGMHWHPAHVIIAQSPGKTVFTMEDGSNRTLETKKDEVRWSDPVTHSQEAMTDVSAIVVEMKKKTK